MNDDDVRDAYAILARSLTAPIGAVSLVRTRMARRRRVQVASASGLTATAVAASALVAAQLTGTDRGSGSVDNPPTTSTATTSAGHRPSYAAKHAIDEWRWETSFGQYRKDLLALAESYDNFSGYKLIFKSRSFLVYGSGQPSSAVAAMIAESPERAHTRWVTVPYSAGELQHAANVVASSLPRVATATERRDYSGIVVGIFAKSLSPADRAHLHALARALTSVPITFIASGGYVLPF